MNRLVLIGNGFDLAHGLKTSYKDFFYWYWKDRASHFYKEKGNVSVDPLCKLTILQDNSWPLFVFQHQFALKKAEGKDLYQLLTENPDSFEVNNTEFFANICKSVETKQWVDIENEYYSLLVLLHSFVENNYLKLNKQLEHLRDKLITYLKSEESKNVSIIPEIQDKIYCPIKKDEMAVEFIGHSDTNIPKEISPAAIMLLTFNYTSTPNQYVSDSSPVKVNYIHGKLDDTKSVIFGYGDELDEKYQKLRNSNDNECLRHIKSIRYLESDNYRRMLEFIESAPFQICIMGHSCGNSDRTLLNTLFEHRNCVSIKPYFYINERGEETYLELVQNISRNFTDMKLMRDRVVNKTYCEPLTNNKQ